MLDEVCDDAELIALLVELSSSATELAMKVAANVNAYLIVFIWLDFTLVLLIVQILIIQSH